MDFLKEGSRFGRDDGESFVLGHDFDIPEDLESFKIGLVNEENDSSAIIRNVKAFQDSVRSRCREVFSDKFKHIRRVFFSKIANGELDPEKVDLFKKRFGEKLDILESFLTEYGIVSISRSDFNRMIKVVIDLPETSENTGLAELIMSLMNTLNCLEEPIRYSNQKVNRLTDEVDGLIGTINEILNVPDHERDSEQKKTLGRSERMRDKKLKSLSSAKKFKAELIRSIEKILSCGFDNDEALSELMDDFISLLRKHELVDRNVKSCVNVDDFKRIFTFFIDVEFEDLSSSEKSSKITEAVSRKWIYLLTLLFAAALTGTVYHSVSDEKKDDRAELKSFYKRELPEENISHSFVPGHPIEIYRGTEKDDNSLDLKYDESQNERFNTISLLGQAFRNIMIRKEKNPFGENILPKKLGGKGEPIKATYKGLTASGYLVDFKEEVDDRIKVTPRDGSEKVLLVNNVVRTGKFLIEFSDGSENRKEELTVKTSYTEPCDSDCQRGIFIR